MAVDNKNLWVQEQLLARGLKDTKANRKTLNQQWENRYGVGADAGWKEYFVRQFPQYSAMFDGGDGEAKARSLFGNDLINLFIDVASTPENYDLTSQAGLDAFDAKLMATSYYRTTSKKQREWDLMADVDRKTMTVNSKAKIAARYGTLELQDEDLNSITQYALRNGLDDFALDQYVYTYSSGKTAMGVTIGNEKAENLRKIARAYGYNPTDLEDMITSAVTGKTYAPTNAVVTEDWMAQRAKDNAKKLYPHLMQQIDAGYSLDDVFEPYRDLASRTLEKASTSINMTDPLYMKALKPDVNGQQISLGDWERELKTNRRYGYQYTQEANNIAQSMGLFLAQAFGKVTGL